MPVNKRGNRYEASFTHQGQRIRKLFATEVEAKEFELKARQSVLLGMPVPSVKGSSNSYTFGQAVDRTWTMYWKDGKSKKQMMYMTSKLKDAFGTKRPINEITTEVVEDYVLKLKSEGLSNATLNRHLSALSKILKQAQKAGKLEKLPHLEKHKEGKGRIRWLTREEEQAFEQLLRSWGENDIADALIVSIDTGVRASELVGMEYKHISADGVYLGDTKNGESRLVPLTKRAQLILLSRQTLGATRPFPYSSDFYRNVWEKARNHLGLDDVVWHTLRHTCCSRLVQGGMPITHVKEWMGHLAIQTTMRYSHLCPTNLQAGLKYLEAV